MPFDFTREELETYKPDVSEPVDFDAFWTTTLNEAQAQARPPQVEKVEVGLPHVDTYDVAFSGFDGQPIKAWYLRPSDTKGDLAVVVEYIGYGGGRGLPVEHTSWAAAGFSHLVVDVRGQGSVWGGPGGTDDPSATGPSSPGFMTRGIEDPYRYYYRRVIADAALAVDAVPSLPGADPSRIVLTGVSQGGGLTIAAASLRPKVVAAMPDVAFLCNIPRAVRTSDVTPYSEVRTYLSIHRDQVDQAMRTLSYVDAVNFAKRATVPSLWSVGLEDNCCPPSTTFTAYNWYGELSPTPVPKAMETYEFNGHDGGGVHHLVKKMAFARHHVS